MSMTGSRPDAFLRHRPTCIDIHAPVSQGNTLSPPPPFLRSRNIYPTSTLNFNSGLTLTLTVTNDDNGDDNIDDDNDDNDNYE